MLALSLVCSVLPNQGGVYTTPTKKLFVCYIMCFPYIYIVFFVHLFFVHKPMVFGFRFRRSTSDRWTLRPLRRLLFAPTDRQVLTPVMVGPVLRESHFYSFWGGGRPGRGEVEVR